MDQVSLRCNKRRGLAGLSHASDSVKKGGIWIWLTAIAAEEENGLAVTPSVELRGVMGEMVFWIWV